MQKKIRKRRILMLLIFLPLFCLLIVYKAKSDETLYFVKNYKICSCSNTTIQDVFDFRYKGKGNWKYYLFTDRLEYIYDNEALVEFKKEDDKLYVDKVKNKYIVLNNYEKSRYLIKLFGDASSKYYNSNEYLQYRRPEVKMYTTHVDNLKKIDDSYYYNYNRKNRAKYNLSNKGYNAIERIQNSRFCTSKADFIDIYNNPNAYIVSELYYNGTLIKLDASKCGLGNYTLTIFCDIINNSYTILSLTYNDTMRSVTNDDEIIAELNRIRENCEFYK